MFSLLAGFHQAVVRQQLDGRMFDVGQCLCRGAVAGGCRVGGKAPNNVLVYVNGVVTDDRPRRLGAFALVNGDFHQHAAGPGV